MPTSTSCPAAQWPLALSKAAAVLAMAASLVGLEDPRIYAGLTPAFRPQALAQDLANLALASPLLFVTAWLARRGSARAFVVWLGVTGFTVYNYVIYTVSIPFGPLFLPWVAVWGLATYALLGGAWTGAHARIAAAFTSRRALVATAWALFATGAAFAWLWLADDVPALAAGVAPKSLVDAGLPTNPVHVLDLGFFLPGAVAIGVLLLRGRAVARTLAPGFLVFLVLTGVPILLTPAVQQARGEPASWAPAVPIAALAALLVALLAWLLASMRDPGRRGG